jgi:hypothetical protein
MDSATLRATVAFASRWWLAIAGLVGAREVTAALEMTWPQWAALCCLLYVAAGTWATVESRDSRLSPGFGWPQILHFMLYGLLIAETYTPLSARWHAGCGAVLDLFAIVALVPLGYALRLYTGRPKHDAPEPL